MFNLINSIKKAFLSKPWLMYIAIAIIVIGAGLNMFFYLGLVLKILIGLVEIVAFAFLIIFLTVGDEKNEEMIETISMFKLQVRTNTNKAVDNVMIITYSAIVVFGTFINSMIAICIGIVMFIVHCIATIIARIYYTKKYRQG